MPDHTPVLLNEVLGFLAPEPGQNFIDATFGRGGHAKALAERILPDGKLMAIDCDEEAIRLASELGPNIKPVHGNFSNIKELASHVFINFPINGVLIDCGLSSAQLTDPVRGLSFLREGPLDMRMDRTQIMTANEIVNRWSETKLAALIHELGEEPFAKRIAAAIVAARRSKPIATTIELAEMIARAVRRRGRIHPATKTFQAIRMRVNDELENLAAGISGALEILTSGGRLAVITFHSLEDRLAKQAFRTAAQTGQFKILTKHVVRPIYQEICANPRSRSAKLRVIEKI